MGTQDVIIYDGPVPEDWVNEGPVEGDLGEQILRDVLGVFGN